MDKPHFEDYPGDYTEEYRHRPFRRSRLIKLAAFLTLLAFVAFSFMDLSYLFGPRLDFLNQNPGLMNDPLVIKSKPAVVAIETTVLSSPIQASVHRGTGFNVDPQGIIITNQHVVASGQNITVTFSDGHRFMIRNYVSVPGQDLAIIRLDSNQLPFINLANENDISVGDTVTVIGNPLGLQKIAQRGTIVSGPSPYSKQSSAFEVDVAINPGNSGSPVINEEGKVIGVVFASISRKEQGETVTGGLAIPVKNLEEQLNVQKIN